MFPAGCVGLAYGPPLAWTLHMSTDPQDAKRSIENLRQEINRLIKEQLDAYKSATVLSMTAAEAEQCDARQESIRKLVEELWQRRAAIKNFNV